MSLMRTYDDVRREMTRTIDRIHRIGVYSLIYSIIFVAK